MQKFTEFVQEQKTILESVNKEAINAKFESLCGEALESMNVKSIADLTNEQLDSYNSYIKYIRESLRLQSKEKVFEAGDIKNEKDFKAYAEEVLKSAHGDKYDEKIAKKVIDDLVKKSDGDWGEAVGRLTSGLGS